MSTASQTPSRSRSVWMILLILAVLGYAGSSWRNIDVNRISRKVERLRAALTKTSDEPPLQARTRAREITGFFAPQATVILGDDVPLFSDQEELTAATYSVRTSVDEISVKVHDKSIRLSEDRQTAWMEVTAEALVSYRGKLERKVRSFRLEWVKQNGNWLIRRVEPLEIIRRPAR